MKIGITTTDGKKYILANEYESVVSAIQQIRTIYSSTSLAGGINHFGYTIMCKDDIYVFVDKIVSIFEIKS